jgi:predicted dinucleotide-binding enzyme
MKIGILGSVMVGKTLATAFLKESHAVMMGTRDTSKADVMEWKSRNPSARTGSFAETAAFGELLVLATKGTITPDVIKLAGEKNFSAKTVIDATNPIADARPVNGVIQFYTDINQSLMERLQKLLPDAKLVKAFNSVGNALMYKPDLPGGPPTMFICGNDDQAKLTASDILKSFGWEVEDMGKAEAARAIEPLCILWCIPGFLSNEWSNHAFKLLKG